MKNKKRTRSLKIIRIKRNIRFFKAIIMQIMIIASIILSSFVIYYKRNSFKSINSAINGIKYYALYGMNQIDNHTTNLENIKINKLKYIPIEQIKEIVDKIPEDNTISYIDFIYDEVKKIPFVKNVIIKKRIFRSIEIKIDEIKIIATMKDKNSNETYLIDNFGKYIKYQKQEITKYHFATIKDATIDDIESFMQLYNALDNCQKMKKLTTQYINISDRRWDVILKNDSKIMFSAMKFELAIPKICKLSEKGNLDILYDQSNTEYVDARIEDRIYYKLKNEN